jgi:hypothetical protein
MKSLKNARDVLGVIWGISIIVRIIGKVTNLYVIPKWSGYLIFGAVSLYIVLSLYIYLKEKTNK